MGIGFIQDKLEIKFLILYIAARVSEPLTLAEMQELTMCDGGIDYFTFSECLSDLVKTEHLYITADDRYEITVKGLRNSEICESSLPYSVRMHTDRNIAECNREFRRRAQVRGRVTPRDNGTYTVELALSDDVDSLLRLELMVASEAMAKDLTERFQKDPEQLYARLVETLYGDK